MKEKLAVKDQLVAHLVRCGQCREAPIVCGMCAEGLGLLQKSEEAGKEYSGQEK